jgi:hypothetical protein
MMKEVIRALRIPSQGGMDGQTQNEGGRFVAQGISLVSSLRGSHQEGHVIEPYTL